MKKYEKKNYLISVRTTQKDYRRCLMNAKFVDMSFSDYVREAVLNYLPNKKGGIAATLKRRKESL